MKFPVTIFVAACLGALASAGPACAEQPAETISAELRALAAQTESRAGSAALRHYALTVKSSRQKALAFFVLGYREYEAEQYAPAAEDLKRASEPNSPLDDFADFYRATALDAGGRPGEAARLLDDFSSRHPQSALRTDALALLARSLTDSGQPERALEALAAEPAVAERPSLLLARARAVERAGRRDEAARDFQQVYFHFPLSPEAAEAQTALQKLLGELGRKRFPEPSAELLTARAEALLAHDRFPQALKTYTRALEIYPESADLPRWRIGRARCLLDLGRSTEALDALQSPFPADPAQDAERLATLVEVYAHRADSASIEIILAQLRAVYPQSPAYAEALGRAGNYYRRQGNWKSAAPYYEALASSFPHTSEGGEAAWQLAWAAYLERQPEAARSALAAYVSQNATVSHVPEALFWLGRLAESDKAMAVARTLYETLATRYTHDYFAGEAEERLKILPAGNTEEPEGVSSEWSAVARLPNLIPQAPLPPPWLCPAPAGEAKGPLEPAAILTSLALGNLAEGYLKSLLLDRADDPEVHLALSQLEAARGEVSKSVLSAGRAFPRYEEYDFSRTPQGIWDLLFPRRYWDLVREQAKARGLDPYWVMGLIRQESAFNPAAVSRSNARGLMQVLPETASPRRSGRRTAARRLGNAAYNVRFGSGYLEDLIAGYKGVPEYALAAYHAGKFRVDDWLAANHFQEPAEFLESIPIPATRVYVEHVLRDARIYRELMAGTPTFRRCP